MSAYGRTIVWTCVNVRACVSVHPLHVDRTRTCTITRDQHNAYNNDINMMHYTGRRGVCGRRGSCGWITMGSRNSGYFWEFS
jgi:hypothetical protein